VNKIKCVTFDLDDTLWAVHPVVIKANDLLWEWLEREVPAYTERFTLNDLAEGSALRRSLLERYPEIAHSMTETRIRLLEEGMVSVGLTQQEAEAKAAAAFDLFLHHRHAVTPYDQAVEMLQQLKDQGLLIGALSNGNAEVAKTPLAQWFDFQFNADSVGTAKPHPLMFEKALEYASVSACEVVHVGDHPINDVRAAKELGMRTIWVNPEGVDWAIEVDADWHADKLSEIPKIVSSLNR
jgi:HAD superfamily hydrolase (TIGR01509 family)